MQGMTQKCLRHLYKLTEFGSPVPENLELEISFWGRRGGHIHRLEATDELQSWNGVTFFNLNRGLVSIWTLKA